jgi:ribose-phosphate pyrophosphokinase
METATVTVTAEEKHQGSASGAPGDGAGPAQARVPEAAASAKEAKPAPERKKPGRLSEDKRFKLFSGTANPELARKIGEHIGVPVGEAKLQRFADGEVYFQLLENVRGVDVFVVQPTCYPVDQHLVELLVMIDALKRASAARITAVMPYYGYARQDRKDRPRVAISAKLIADLLTTAGANRALFLDLHAAQIQGFFNIPVDHLFASPVLVDHFRGLRLPNLTVVSPDAGGVERARFFAQKVGAPLAIVDKRRTELNVAEVMHVVGDVSGQNCLIIDDIIDTAGTLVKTVDALYASGAAAVYACASHAVLSGPAIDRIANSRLQQVVVTDTIPLREAALKVEKIKVLSIAGLVGTAIENIHKETSISSLFS